MLNKTLSLVRAFHNLNKVQVAEKVGLSKSYITELESGDKKVTLEVLEKYSRAFGIPISSLLLFDETAQDGSFAEALRIGMTGKIVRMLEWLSAITEEADGTDEEPAAKTGTAAR